MKFLVAVALAFSILSGLPGSVEASAGSGCTQWTSTVTPPPSIRVHMVKERKVVVVPFKLYVERVIASEWGHYLPYQLQRAGAVAAKQYAWYHILHYRGGHFNGRCFDVRDTTADQIYRVRPLALSTIMAVESTWTWRVVKSGKPFFMTGYRTGRAVGCARDVNGWKLHARSARRCANAGWSAKRILEVYYQAHVRR